MSHPPPPPDDPPATLVEPSLRPVDVDGLADPVPAPPAHVLLWAALGGLAIGPVILYVDLPAWSDTDREVAKSGPFQLWVTAIAVQTMFWVLAFPVVRTISRRWRTPRLARSREVTLATAALLLAAALVTLVPRSISDLPDVVPHRWEKVTVITLAAFALAIYAARATWFATARVRELAEARAADVTALSVYRRLRADLQILLGILGTSVTLAVVASAALRVLTVRHDPDDAIPAEGVIVYGIILSLLLALIFLPAYLALLRSGRALQEVLAPLGDVGAPDLDARLARRRQLDELLGLDVAATRSFRAGVAILGPLLGSLTSLLPNLGG